MSSSGLSIGAIIDDTLGLNFQTFVYPFTISFPNLNALEALDPHQVAIVTLSANLIVQVQSVSTGRRRQRQFR